MKAKPGWVKSPSGWVDSRTAADWALMRAFQDWLRRYAERREQRNPK